MKADKNIGFIVARRSRFGISVNLISLSDINHLSECIKALTHWCFTRNIFIAKFLFLPNETIKDLKKQLHFSKNSNIYFTVKSPIQKLQYADTWIVQMGDVQ